MFEPNFVCLGGGGAEILRTHVEMLVKETETVTVTEQSEATAMEEE